jgi:hypothetical protein
LFATPLACGRVTANASFEPYGGGRSVKSSVPVTIQPLAPAAECAAPPFSPQLVTGRSTPMAGQLTTESAALVRRSGEQLPRTFSMAMPPGMSASLGTVRPCPSPAATLGACSLESRVGSALAKVGSGSSSVSLPGSVYLTGPYRQAPFGLLTEFQGKIGPLDLGTIVTRSAMEVNRHNGKLTTVTAGIPDRVEGVPVRFQSIELSLDRPGFLRNPTSCSPSRTEATFESQSGAMASASSSIKIKGCRKLGFKPRIRLNLLGRRELHKHGTPVLQISTRLRPGDSNLRGLRLSLPPVLRTRIGALREICSRQDAENSTCPDGAQVGTVVARSPVVGGVLRGSIDMVQPDGEGLPDMWMSLEGEGVPITLRAHTSTDRNGRLITVMRGLPDSPLSSFVMRLGGQRSRAISLEADPCVGGRPRRFFVAVDIAAQNGRRRTFQARIGTKAPCGESTR